MQRLVVILIIAVVFLRDLIKSQQIAFTPSECTAELKGSSFKCVTLSATFYLNENQESIDELYTKYSMEDGSGFTALKNPIRMQIAKRNNTAQALFGKKKVVYNTYELFEPGESCAISAATSMCSDSDFAPSDYNGYVLCCLDRATRGTGGHCLRTDYTQKYEAYAVTAVSDSDQVDITITHRGKTFTYNLDSYQPTSNIAYEGSAHLYKLPVQEQSTIETRIGTDYSFFRDARDPSISITDLSKWFIVNQYDLFKLLMSSNGWSSLARCSDSRGLNVPHDDPDQVT
jgi:hypothetical protein